MPSPRRILAVLFATALWLGAFGAIDLIAPWFLREGSTVSDVGYGALTGIVVPVGFLLFGPQALVGAAAYAVAGLLSGDHRYVGFATLVAGAAAILLALRRRRPRRPRLAVAVLSAGAAAAFFPYAWDMADHYRRGLPPYDSHVGLDQWTGLAAFALAIPVVPLLGTRVAAWSAGAGAAVWGVACVAFPHDAGSVGRGWGAAAIAWGAAVALAARGA